MDYQGFMNAIQIFTVIFSLIIIITTYVLTSLGYMKCMEKAGEEKWKAWVPFYNDIIMYKIVGLSPWFATVGIIKSALSVIVAIVTLASIGTMADEIDEALQKDKNRINNGYYYSYDTEIENVAGRYNLKKMGPAYTLDLIESMFSIAALVINIFFAIYITKAYGLSGGYIAGMIIVPLIFILIIGFGKSEYKGKYSMGKGTVEA